MKKTLVISAGALLLFSSCGTYTGAGAYTGGTFGSMIGSAIGGIAGGPRGSDIGSLIGMAGGAAVGAAVGAAADNAQQQRYEEWAETRASRRGTAVRPEDRPMASRGGTPDGYGSRGGNLDDWETRENSSGGGLREEGDYSGSREDGDDRLYGWGEDFGTTVTPANASLEIRHVRIQDSSRDRVLSRGEEARVVFEVFNTSSRPAYRIQPFVTETTGNRHIRISENVMVESIMPGGGIRYTASIKAGSRLKDGRAIIRIGVLQGNQEIRTQTREFTLQTSRR